MKLEFIKIDLLENVIVEKNEFKEIFNFNITYNFPKIISLNDKIIILLYDNNQISIIDIGDNQTKKNNKNYYININNNIMPNYIQEIQVKK